MCLVDMMYPRLQTAHVVKLQRLNEGEKGNLCVCVCVCVALIVF